MRMKHSTVKVPVSELLPNFIQ
uniref:Uncharacterized protein n=1 Tax=Bracon brevicornis TaxID=1563983 RepID=A0A6V7IGG1_9HYME